jgi:hypothetical protein
MAAMTKDQMLSELNAWFAKVENSIINVGVGKYQEGTLTAGQVITVDLPTLLGFTVANVNIASVGVDIKVDDPESAANPKPIIPAYALIDYSIAAATGVLTITNKHTTSLKYYARFNTPVKK